jgi:chromosome partitioning protein
LATRTAVESGYDVLPANGDLTAAEVEMLSIEHKESRLRTALAEVAGQYDYVLIDCPPSLNMLTINALVAADGVIIAMQCEYFALEGLAALVRTIEGVAETMNSNLQIEGILRTMYDPRNSLTNQVSAQLHQHFSGKVYRTVVPRNIRLAEAPSHGLPVMHYDRNSRGSKAYMALAGEIIRRQESQHSPPPAPSTTTR